MKGERFLCLPLAVEPSNIGGILPDFTLNSPPGVERFLCLPLAVEPWLEGEILLDLTLNSPRGG